MVEKNNEYFDKYGFIFIVFAHGKTPKEMLEMLKKRLNNKREDELKIAIKEQEKIIHLRLNRVSSGDKKI